MLDMLPFLTLRETTTEGQIKEIAEYLAQFKEQLEFILSNITEQNLSPSLSKKLSDLTNNMRIYEENREEELAQVSNKTSKEDIG